MRGAEGFRIPPRAIGEGNEEAAGELERAYAALGAALDRRGISIEAVTEEVRGFAVAIPSWGLAAGGTRFGRFPVPGEPRNLYEKLADAATVHELTGAAPRVALHIPWDTPDDPAKVRAFAEALGIGFDAVNSNTFQDQPGQPLSYKFGSLSHTDPRVRAQAVAHNKHVVEVGRSLGSRALSVWIGDGGSFPGQIHLRRALERTIDSLGEIYAALPDDWRLFLEYKPFEPAFYSTVIQDWGTAYVIVERLGPRAGVLVDLGHHLPATNVEQIVARLVALGRLAGFHFNDSRFADDDLTAGSIDPFGLFLVFCELVEAARDPEVQGFDPAYMIDQSHCLKDPIEAFLSTAGELQRAYAKALLPDREALSAFQDAADVTAAERELRCAYETDVTPIIQEARRRNGAAVDPIAVFRRSGYRDRMAEERPGGAPGGGAFV